MDIRGDASPVVRDLDPSAGDVNLHVDVLRVASLDLVYRVIHNLPHLPRRRPHARSVEVQEGDRREGGLLEEGCHREREGERGR